MDVDAVVSPPHVARPLRLLPFRALMLAPSRIGEPASVRALTRPYRTVASRLERWEERGQLSRDEEPALYLHEYTSDGITVRGLVGALDISHRANAREEVAVFPHEGIHPEQVEELAARMLQMQINPAPILLVHHGSAEVRDLLRDMRKRTAHLEFTDRGAQQHRVWAIGDPGELELIEQALAPTRVLIADGHHRYAAYLRMQQDQPGPATNAGLAMLVDQDDTPLYLGAIHRVLGRTTLSAIRVAAERGAVPCTDLAPATALESLAPDRLVATDGRDWIAMRVDVRPDRAAVEALNDDLLAHLATPPRSIGHHHSVEDALAAVRGRASSVAVLMPAPEFEQVMNVTAADRLLPEKATSFQPKPNVGVLIRSMRDE